MAEAGGFDIRRLSLVAGTIIVVAFSGVFFLYRSCGQLAPKKGGMTVIYSNLELKDAANSIARLKELNIPYEIKEEGRAIAVPKEKADQARLGLAEKKLPVGGAVGWEIFDESRLGATDFDRRIQLIRAISGELSRTIRRIDGVEEVRVQIVIPETKLFAANVAPVTASVLLRLQPGLVLERGKINGIVYLVASSVENLQPENVTVIDESGRVLTAKAFAAEEKVIPAPPPAEKVVVLPAQTLPSVEAPVVTVASREKTVAATPEGKATAEVVTQTASLSAEEKILLKAQAKKELELDLSGKAQELLNRFYPLNGIIIRVGVELRPTKEKEIRVKDLKVKKLYAIILVDNRIDLSKKLKESTFTTVAAAIGYNKKRGDKIILQKVPFHLATPLQEITPEATAVKKAPAGINYAFLGYLLWFGSIGVIAAVAVWLFQRFVWRRPAVETTPAYSGQEPETARERVSSFEQIRGLAERSPEKIADLLKGWLSEQ